MTKNKLKKKDLINDFESITADQKNPENWKPYKKIIDEWTLILESEVEVTLCQFEGKTMGDNLSLRNIVCANNCIRCLFERNFFDAYWEMTDVLSYKKDEDYISENEIAVVYILLRAFQEAIRKEENIII